MRPLELSTISRQQLNRWVLACTFLPFCWQAFQVVHELGHVLVAIFSGGKITRLVLHPLEISRTDVFPNYFPLWVAWGGPLIGAFLPCLLWAVFRFYSLPGVYLIRFFAGFCLIANGTYVAFGSFGPIGDAKQLLNHGAPLVALWVYGVLASISGIWIWHNLGRHFGWGKLPEQVEDWAPYTSTVLFLSLFIVTWSTSPR